MSGWDITPPVRPVAGDGTLVNTRVLTGDQFPPRNRRTTDAPARTATAEQMRQVAVDVLRVANHIDSRPDIADQVSVSFAGGMVTVHCGTLAALHACIGLVAADGASVETTAGDHIYIRSADRRMRVGGDIETCAYRTQTGTRPVYGYTLRPLPIDPGTAA